MKRALMLLLCLALLAGLSGCLCRQTCTDGCGMPGTCASSPETCAACGDDFAACGCGLGARLFDRDPGFRPGPPSAAVTYPYYTVRGPRDFLASDPRSIGP